MCGRYTLHDPALIGRMCTELFRIEGASLPQRFNAAREQLLPVLALSEDARPVGTTMKWGLVPSSESPAKPRIAAIHAKAEEMQTQPMFMTAFQHRRCLVPADGFYEWKRLDADAKQPYYVRLKNGRPFFFAGVFERARGGRAASFALVTTRPNELMKPIHVRMPVLLTGAPAREWLTPTPIDTETLARLTQPFLSSEMEVWPVSRFVNRRQNDAPECMARHQDAEPVPVEIDRTARLAGDA